MRQAVDLLDQAVRRDPSFFDAYCQLAVAHGYIYAVLGSIILPPGSPKPKRLFWPRHACGQMPAETHLARAQYLYFGLRDYAGALAELEVARRTLSNDARIFELTGYILRRRGQREEGLRNLERALELDPRNFFILQQIALSYENLRRFRDAISALDRALTIVPDNSERRLLVLRLSFAGKRTLVRSTRRLIQSWRGIPPRLRPRPIAGSFARWSSAIRLRPSGPWSRSATISAGANSAINLSRNFGEGLLARVMKDEARARAAFGAARAEQEKIVQAQPDYGPALCVLASSMPLWGAKKQPWRKDGGRSHFFPWKRTPSMAAA